MAGVTSIEKFAAAALDTNHVTGHTHNFYRYPARFSPRFVREAIECFSSPGDLVLDPYSGGGTTIVEAYAAGRRVVGNDLNSLAAFLCRVKTTFLSTSESDAISAWIDRIHSSALFNTPLSQRAERLYGDVRTKNMNLPRSRFIKKITAVLLSRLEPLPSDASRDFVRCVILRTGQWALDGRSRHTSVSEFKYQLCIFCEEMLECLGRFKGTSKNGRVTILEGDASKLNENPIFKNKRVDLVVTSPPYPGVHILYHRWQIDGRRESPAPYWIAGCNDGEGASYYNFGGRFQTGLHSYFDTSLKTLTATRQVMKTGATMVQMVAFSNPKIHLPRYLNNMEQAGFEEIYPIGCRSDGGAKRIWRSVPGRRWHAASKGDTPSSREVVLVHKAC